MQLFGYFPVLVSRYQYLEAELFPSEFPFFEALQNFAYGLISTEDI